MKGGCRTGADWNPTKPGRVESAPGAFAALFNGRSGERFRFRRCARF
jgi:hypothetical protein